MVLKDIRQGSLALTDLTLAVPNLVRDGWMEEEFLARLPDTMEHNSTLKGLVIDASGDTPAADCGPLFRALGRSRSVEELTLKNCELTGELARKIMDGCVAQNTSLVTITLLGCTLGDGGVGVVAAALPGCRNLRNIHIIPRDLRDGGLVEVVRCHWLWAAQDDPEKKQHQLVELKTRVLNRDEDGFTKLGAAADCGNAELVQLLFDLGADVNECIDARGSRTPLVVAAMSGHAPIVELLHRLGANIGTQHGCDAITPLHCAAMYGRTEVVQLLAGLGAEVNASSNSGRTPLHHAAEGGWAPVVRLLLADLVCSVNTPNNDGFMPVHLASSNATQMFCGCFAITGPTSTHVRTAATRQCSLLHTTATQRSCGCLPGSRPTSTRKRTTAPHPCTLPQKKATQMQFGHLPSAGPTSAHRQTTAAHLSAQA